MYRALYRKWRPRRFEDVVGQSATVAALKNQVSAGRVGHAYLFTGVRGTGKTTCAKIFAKAVNCLHPQNGDPCGECEICRGIDDGSVLDVIEMDAASNNGVDDIRDLREETAYTPSACRYRVYIIDEVHMLSSGAFNALLKTLEEPPDHVIFILATTEIRKVPATILSRCQRYDFTRIRPEDIAGRVQQVAAGEHLEVTPGAAGLIARLADGALRDALSILDTCAGVATCVDEAVVRRMAGVTDKSYLFRLSDAIAAQNSTAALAELAELRQQSVDMKRLADELVAHYRNLMLAGLPGGRELLAGVSPEEETAYLEKAAAIPQSQSIRAIRTIGAALEQMSRGSDQRIALELAIFTLTEGPLDQTSAAAVQPASGSAAAPAQAAPAVRPFTAAPVQPFAASTSPAAVQTAAPAETAAAVPAEAKAAEDRPPWEEETAAVQQPAQKPENLPAAAEGFPPAPQKENAADEVPPPSDADAPLQGEQLPPWEEQPMAPAPVPEPKKAPAQKPAVQPEAAAAAPPAAVQAGDGPQRFAPWEQIIRAMEQRDPMLYGTLKKSKAYYDGRRVLIDGGRMFRDFIRANKDSQRLIKKMIQEIAGISCGIGPYEQPAARSKNTGNAEQALETLQQRGLDVEIRDTAGGRR